MNFTVTLLILLIAITGTLSIDFGADARFQDEWTGVCADGLLQSPIVIPAKADRTSVKSMTLEFTNMQLPIKQVKVTNSVRQTVFEWNRENKKEDRSVIIRTTADVVPFKSDALYILQNFHVHHSMNEHSGTMHTIDGSFYAMEMHFLFALAKYDFNTSAALATPGNVVELVVLWKLSNVRNGAWSKLNDLMLSKELKDSEKITSDVSLSLGDFIPKSTFSLHHGSLPAVGCGEVITWLVFDKVMEFDTADLGMRHWTYVSARETVQLQRNVRHIQSRNGRPVYYGQDQKITYKEYKTRD